MPNQRRQRKIQSPPPMDGFKPYGVRMRNMEKVILLFEEYEAIRLIDHEDLNQEEAAARMDVSRPTFTRIYKKARQTVAKALVEGKALLIEGGTYISENYWVRCGKCSKLTTAPDPVQNCPHCHSDKMKNIHQPE
ncbi:putative DNA-binding protein (UPF0251 family) [Marinilabilia salmonicolor]|uniref:DUF134 domain-containing protein n=1 Tax=Marinilabilia salmonicolor TaxID=989 RepID=UPI000D06F2E5|nr:DUF134 domain-containing protein [Marinilabilia salmonicolor]PRZ00399.1 putative DNA-binding protein (UPF0251 family) [Marinilabilia salmonicolor]